MSSSINGEMVAPSSDVTVIDVSDASDLVRQAGQLRELLAVRDADLERSRAHAAVLEAELARQRERADVLDRRIESLNDAAIEWADDNDLCRQFERFCEEHGLRGRTEDYEVTVRVTQLVTIHVSDAPRDADRSDLTDLIDSSTVEETVRDQFAGLSSDDWEVTDWSYWS